MAFHSGENEPFWSQQREALPFNWLDDMGAQNNARAVHRLNAEEMKSAYSLVEKLKWNSPVKKIAEMLLNQPGRAPDSIQPLIHALIRPNRTSWRERQVAAWALGRAPLNAAQRAFASETLVQLMECRLERDVSGRFKRAFWKMLPFSILLMAMADSRGATPETVFFGVCLYPLAYLYTASRDNIASVCVRSTAAVALGHLSQPESVDVLAYSLFQTNHYFPLISQWSIKERAVQALIPVLASLNSEHYGRFKSETIQYLTRALNNQDDQLAVAILMAFRYIGDRSTIPAVQKLASGSGRAAKDNRIREAANIALPLIMTRVENENNPHTLLRGSTAPVAPHDQLLRSLGTEPVPDPLSLLRAAGDNSSPPTPRENALIIDILSNLEQSGDVRALPYVEKIAANGGASANVRQAAEGCLPTLRAHAEIDSVMLPPRLPVELEKEQINIQLGQNPNDMD